MLRSSVENREPLSKRSLIRGFKRMFSFQGFSKGSFRETEECNQKQLCRCIQKKAASEKPAA